MPNNSESCEISVEKQAKMGDTEEVGTQAVGAASVPDHTVIGGDNVAKPQRTTAPAFQFYPKDFLSSSRVQRMSLTEIGAYIVLLSHNWLAGGIPTDPNEIAKIVKMPAPRFRRLWAGALSECFVKRGTMLTNERLDAERKKQMAFRERQSVNGRKGGRRVGDGLSQPNPSLSTRVMESAESSTGSSVLKEKEERLDVAFLAFQQAYPSARRKGGFLVQQDFTTELLKNVFAVGTLAEMCSTMPISANSNSIKINVVDETSRADGYRGGGAVAYWTSEADTVTAGKIKFGQVEWSLNKLMAIYYATDELLADASALESLFMEEFSNEIKFKLDDAIFRGDGSGKPLGILNSGALVTQNKETGQAADTIVVENIFNMYNRMIGSSRPNAVWLINQECEPQLWSMVLSAGTAGHPVYLPANGISGSPYGTLFGRNVVPIEHASALGDVGDIVLADMKKYRLANKGGMKAASSIHVKFEYDEMAFRITYRVDGHPIMDSPMTPYKGTASRTLGSFVALQAR